MALYKYGKMPQFSNLYEGCGLEGLCSNGINLRRHHVKNCFNNIFAEQQQQEVNLMVFEDCNCKIVNMSTYIPWPGWDQ